MLALIVYLSAGLLIYRIVADVACEDLTALEIITLVFGWPVLLAVTLYTDFTE